MAHMASVVVFAAFLPAADALRDQIQTNWLKSENFTQHRPICDTSIVQETARLLGAANSSTGEPLCSAPLLAAALSTDLSQVQLLLASLHEGSGKSGTYADPTCSALCDQVTARLSEQSRLPPYSEVACGCDGAESCDIDVRTSSLVALHMGESDIPNLHDRGMLDDERENITNATTVHDNPTLECDVEGKVWNRFTQGGIDYSKAELLGHVANLFLIFPVAVSHEECNLREAEIVALAEAYATSAIRDMRAQKKPEMIDMWFGKGSANDSQVTTELQRILNNVVRIISKFVFVYKGSECSELTYAYVYPRASSTRVSERCTLQEAETTKCVNTLEGNPIVYICDLYMRAEKEKKVEVLLHEASHHAVSYTDDVCMDEFWSDNADIFLELPDDPSLNGRRLGELLWMPLPAWMVPHDRLVQDPHGRVLCQLWGRTAQEYGCDTITFLLLAPEKVKGGCRRVGYSRQNCQELAMLSPRKALRNADNFCYFVADMVSLRKGRAMKCSSVGGWCVGDRVHPAGNSSLRSPGTIQYRTPKTNAGFKMKQSVVARQQAGDPWWRGTIIELEPEIKVKVRRVPKPFAFNDVRASQGGPVKVAMRMDADGEPHVLDSCALVCEEGSLCRGGPDPDCGSVQKEPNVLLVKAAVLAVISAVGVVLCLLVMRDQSRPRAR